MEAKTKIMSALIFLSLTSPLPSEQQKVPWRGRIEKGDGFMIIKNPKNPMYAENICILEEEISLGGTNEARKEYIFSNIKEIDADENGNLYVLDVKNKEIKVFDKDGIFSKSIGSIGQGPGEFQWPWSLFVLDQRQIVVADLMQRSLIFYTLDGKFDRRISTISYNTCVKFAINSRNEIIAELPAKGAGGGFVIKKFNPEFEEVETIAVKEREKIPLIEGLAPRIFWCIDNEDKIVWGDSEKYEINVCDAQGKMIQRIIKAFDPIRIRESEYRDVITKKFGGRPIPPNFEQELPKFYPAFQSISVDNMGRIIVKTFEKSERGENYHDVFDRQGRYLARKPLNSVYQVWKNNRLYATEIDEREGTQLVRSYKVNWKLK